MIIEVDEQNNIKCCYIGDENDIPKILNAAPGSRALEIETGVIWVKIAPYKWQRYKTDEIKEVETP